MRELTSRKNEVIAHLRKLVSSRSYRRQCGEFVCDGHKLYAEALRSGAEIRTVLSVRGAEPEVPVGAELYVVPEDLLVYVSRMETPNRLLFTCRIPEPEAPRRLSRGRYLVLDGLQDPGNVGTILRTAEAFSLDAVMLLPGCADLYNAKTVRATMGAAFRQRCFEVQPEQLADLLRAEGIPLYAAALSDRARCIQDFDLSSAAVVIGSEGSGVCAEVLALCDGELIIPMSGGAESLNAAVAAAIVLWEMAGR